jgi:hypothetical protein
MAWVVREIDRGTVELESTESGARAEVYNSPSAYYAWVTVDTRKLSFSLPLVNFRYAMNVLEPFDTKDWEENPWALLYVFVSGFSGNFLKRHKVPSEIASAYAYQKDFRKALSTYTLRTSKYYKSIGMTVHETIPFGRWIEKLTKSAIRSIASRSAGDRWSIDQIKLFVWASKRLMNHPEVPPYLRSKFREVWEKGLEKIVVAGLSI